MEQLVTLGRPLYNAGRDCCDGCRGKTLDVQHEAKLEQYALRLATNFTAHRNHVVPCSGKYRWFFYGEKVHPLPRIHISKQIIATPPERLETWVENGISVRAEIGENLVLSGVIPGLQAKTFSV